MRELTENDVEFTVECLEEDTRIRGNFMDCGDDAADKAAEDEIIEQLENGNPWAWCTVEVEAQWTAPDGTSYSGCDYLRCCSYASRRDFERDGYYAGMRDRALEDLNATLAKQSKHDEALRAALSET